MRHRAFTAFGLMFAVGVAAAACTDVPGPTGPELETPPAFAKGGSDGNKGATRGRKGHATDPGEASDSGTGTLELLDRDRPLNRDIAVTATIDALGGHIRIPEAGFDLKIPAGAVSHPTDITVTALKGKKVAYEFAPHGLRFHRSVEFRQEVGRTTVETLIERWGLGQEYKNAGGYLVPPDLLWGIYFEGTVRNFVPLEFFKAVLKNFWITFEFDHFSGYALASG